MTHLNGCESSLAPQEVAAFFPLMLRHLSCSNQITTSGIECTPHDGEQTRFGVYFYALRGQLHESEVPTLPYVVVPTNELFLNGGIDHSLVHKGVLVFPSEGYQTEAEQLSRQRVSPYEIDRQLNHQWMTLDLAAERRDGHPILSIPCRVSIHPSRLTASR